MAGFQLEGWRQTNAAIRILPCRFSGYPYEAPLLDPLGWKERRHYLSYGYDYKMSMKDVNERLISKLLGHGGRLS